MVRYTLALFCLPEVSSPPRHIEEPRVLRGYLVMKSLIKSKMTDFMDNYSWPLL